MVASQAMATATSDTKTLAHAVVRDLEDRPVEVGTLWQDRPVVLTLIRHFG